MSSSSYLSGKIKNLPSTQTLRAFESAVRLQSFVRAAEELNLTSAAVSRHIHLLEERVGVSLFDRSWGHMNPTGAALDLADKIRRGLTEIQYAISKASEQSAHGQVELKISVLADFATLWLIPNMSIFNEIHPNINLSIHTHVSGKPSDFESSDIGIWHMGQWQEGYGAHELNADKLILCANKKISQTYPLIDATTLADLPLLRITLRDWREWLDVARLPIVEPSSGPILDSNISLVQAAIAGLGFALVRQKFVQQYLQSGILVRVHEAEIRAPISYYATWRKQNRHHREVSKFVKWLSESH